MRVQSVAVLDSSLWCLSRLTGLEGRVIVRKAVKNRQDLESMMTLEACRRTLGCPRQRRSPTLLLRMIVSVGSERSAKKEKEKEIRGLMALAFLRHQRPLEAVEAPQLPIILACLVLAECGLPKSLQLKRSDLRSASGKVVFRLSEEGITTAITVLEQEAFHLWTQEGSVRSVVRA